jgi:protease-4
MAGFFKIFFASLLAMIVFSVLAFFFFISFVAGMAVRERPSVKKGSVLVLDLGQHFSDQHQQNAFGFLADEPTEIPGVYEVVRMIRKAKTDNDISAIYVIANDNPNGFAASKEIRDALLDFKSGGKFIIAYGDIMTQKAYSVANAAEKIYVSPQGFMEWTGYNVTMSFIKGTLDKLEIEPQIFYAGKFKSATEPLRLDKMTPENKLQTSVWLHDLYNELLINTSAVRKIDTSTLRRLANDGIIVKAKDAVDNKLLDALKYDDEVKDEIKANLKIDKKEKIEFISIDKYVEANRSANSKGDKIVLIYAEGNIIDGKGEQGAIGSETFRNLIRKARLDASVKAVVFRINSGGGSALASENIWRELSLTKKEKPVIVSFGDVAASGGYYIATAADSIFASPGTITGSIGVFGIIPNMEGFFKNKLGITFDGVKTGPYADNGTFTRPMSDNEKRMVQASIDLIYATFIQRVADGRKLDTAYVDSIAQGRVWTGVRAKEIGLVDRLGGLDQAIRSAASMAKLTEYRIKEYPEQKNIFERLFGKEEPMNLNSQIRGEVGEENFKIYQELKSIKEMSHSPQARIPFQFFIN